MAQFGIAGAAGAVQAGREYDAKALLEQQQAAEALQNALAERELNRQRLEQSRQAMGFEREKFTAGQTESTRKGAALEQAAKIAEGTNPLAANLIRAGADPAVVTGLLVPKAPGEQDWVTRAGQVVPIARGTAQPGDQPYARPAAQGFEWVTRGGAPVQIQEGTAKPGDVPFKQPTAPQAPTELERLRTEQLRGQMGEAAAQKQAQRTTAVSTAQDTMNVIRQLADEDPVTGQLTLKGATQNLYGMRNPIAQYIPGSETATAAGALARLKGRTLVDLLQELKTQSRTGASGFGQLSDADRIAIENAASQLGSSFISDQAAQAELQRIYDALKKVGGGTVRMRAPTGEEMDVAEDQVQHYTGLGATVVRK